MKGYPTTFLEMFDSAGDHPVISEIEIPIIQRDYAQGRSDDETSGIRERFLDALIRAATTDTDQALDFVYGEVRNGVLRPLDGQQRLTTLYLMHWYVASQAGELDPDAAWLRFSYATRPTARDFCETLSQHPLPKSEIAPSDWITNQPWYVYPWRQDPTISSMLVVLDAIHERFALASVDFSTVWHRLSSERAIWFLFLPVVDMDYGEDLYIKMNSRGRPLTPFEVFKADIENILRPPLLTPERYGELTEKIDGTWTDLLWAYEKSGSGDFLIDDEFMNYLSFIIDICEWRDDDPDRRWRDKASSRERALEERARLSFTEATSPNAGWNRDFFFHAFDTWSGKKPSEELERLFVANGSGHGNVPLLASRTPDLLGACLKEYGKEFTLTETLLLFAVLIARQAGESITEPEIDRRLRSLRNLAETAFLPLDRVSEYIATTEHLVLHGSLDGDVSFNQYWTADEKLKWKLMDDYPETRDSIHLLEDNPIIRGRLLAFDLEPERIEQRARTFTAITVPELRDKFGAALLTEGDYSRGVGWDGARRQFGNWKKDDSWRDLFQSGSRGSVKEVREPMMRLLDDVGERTHDGVVSAAKALDSITEGWLSEQEKQTLFDWRYYMVRYAGARSSMGDGYFHGDYTGDSKGFAYLRFRLLHGSNYNAYFSDVVLRAAWVEGDLHEDVDEPSWWHRDDPGMSLKGSRVEICNIETGFQLRVPEGQDSVIDQLQQVLGEQLNDDLVVSVKQVESEGRLVDTEDRVQLAVRLVRTLVSNGL